MKPRIDISAKGSLTLWESGAWSEKEKVGRATLISGPEGEKLNVIYDANATTSNFHYLFFAHPGQVVSTAFIRKDSDEHYSFYLRLSKIDSLTVDSVQGEAVAKANFKILWSLMSEGSFDSVEKSINGTYTESRIGYKPEFRELIALSLKKAMLSPKDQCLHWGIPRN